MSDPRSPKPLEGRTKFADRNKPTVSSLSGAETRQPKTSLRFMVPDDAVTNSNESSKFASRKFSSKTSSEIKGTTLNMPKSPSARSKSPPKRTPSKNPTVNSNNVFGATGGGDIFSFDSTSLSKHTLRQEPKTKTSKTKLAPSSTTAALRRAPESVYGATVGTSEGNGMSSPGTPGKKSFSNAMALTAPANQRSVNNSDDNFQFASPLRSSTGANIGRSDLNGGESDTNNQLASPSAKHDGANETSSALQSFLQTAPGKGTIGKGNAVDKSGFFTNFALMEELKTSEQAVEYFLKRQSHKFPVKFLHLVPKEPGHCGFYPYDLEVVNQEMAEAADRHYVMTESGMTAFARAEVEDPSLLIHHDSEDSHNPPAVPPSPTGNDGLSPDGLSNNHHHSLIESSTQLLPKAAVAAGGSHSTSLKPLKSTPSSSEGNHSNNSGVGSGKPKFIVTETMSLGHWVSERNNYRVISQRLRFFSQYLIRKAFGNWFTMMRIRQFARLRHRMSSNLTWSSPSLAPVAVNLKKGSDQMRHVSLIQWEHPQTHKRTAFTTKAFTEIQAVEKANAEKDLDITARAIGDFFVAVTEDLERKKLPPMDKEGSGGGVNGGGVASAASQSIVGMRLKAEAAAKRAKEYTLLINRMPVLGRLGQYTCFEALVGAAVRTCVAGFAAIHAPRRGVGLFETHLTFVRSQKYEALEQEQRRLKEEEEAEGGGVVAPAAAVNNQQKTQAEKDEEEEEELLKEEKEAAYMLEVLKDELVFSPTCSELIDTVISALSDTVDLLTMQSAHELDLPSVLEADFSFHKARDDIQKAITEHYDIATKAVLSFFSDLHKVWTFSRTWKIEKFSDQGDKLEVSDCHDEIEKFNQMLAIVDDGRERTVAGCLTVNALQLRKELVPQLEEQLRTLTKFTAETEKQIKLLRTELDAEKHRFVSHLAKLESDLVRAVGFDDYDKWDRASRVVGELYKQLEEANKTVADFNAREKHYKVDISEWPTVTSMTETLDPFQRTWSMVKGFCDGRNNWMNGPVQEVDAPKAEADVMEWYKKSAKLAKMLEKDTPHLAVVAQRLREDTGDFRKNLPLMAALATPALRLAHSTPHWDKISEILSCPAPLVADSTLTLNSILSQGALNHVEAIEEVSMHASKQYGLEKMLTAMKNEWTPIEFEVKDYRTTGTYVIGGLDDIIALLDEHIVKTQTMRGSPFVKGILDDCVGWENRLKYAQSMLDEWVKVQRTWMYLEPIFASEDIMRQLPQEARAFAEVDKIWRSIMSKAKETPHFLTLADPHLRYEHQFKMANTKLDEVQKGLADYLEVKRNYFPRFFFLSNDELLEIISQTKDPTAVQAHLNKAFEGISRVKFEKDLKITEMRAAKGEIVKLDAAIDPEKGENKGNVECWLLELERMQWQTLKTHTEGGLNDYKVTPRDKWTLRWPQQVILGASSVFWTSEVNAVLSDGGCEALRSYVEDTLNPQLQQIVKLVRGKLNKVQMSTLGALVVIDVHARDTCDVMVAAKVETVHDFNWISQLRYAWDPSWKKGQAVEEGDYTLVCKIVNAKALYGYEYLGNTMRLVITPLTDRCYRTMIGAIELLYGGAPEGPAGTGKTETVKDLSKAVAIHCVVFNCSDSMDYRQMAKFFKGLAGCGSWCCFDEFNRINVEVLSVIAQQLLTINGAKKQGVDMFFFEGTMMKINNNCNAYITMNPGYAGRTELPDNLKALFRPCAMMVPDYALISEIRLYSFGFGGPRPLAQKLVKVLQLSSEQLSSQKHYDYGMRAVQSILVACGAMFEKVGGDPNWTESKIVLRSVYDVNLPKFTVEDLPLFRGITSDLFPGIELPVADHGPLLETIEEQCRLGVTVAPGRVFKQDPIPSFTNKIRELYEMVLVRHGVMICGQTGSGKTVGLHCLKQSLSICKARGYKQFQAVKCYTMNPKSIKSSQLYGTFDENTHEWSDGILPVLYRAAARDSTNDRNWVIFDGPVDAVWIENMNTVLDDNKKLCLNSGEIIKMSDEMTMMFEAEDLEQASPATISRVGMVFCETRNVGWRPLRNVWLWELDNFKEGVLSKQKDYFEELFEWLFLPAIYFVANRCKLPTPVTDMEMIASMLRLLTCLLTLPEGAEFNWDLNKVSECCFLKALVWSVGATVDGNSRPLFNDYLKSLVMGKSSEHEAHADFLAKNRNYDQASFGSRVLQLLPDFKSEDGHEVTLFDVGFDPTKSVWTLWMSSNFEYSIPQATKFNNIVIPTVDTIRNEFLMDQLLLNGYHVLCTGDTGTGKSVSVKKKLLEGMPERFQSIFLNFSAQTGANQTQDIIDGKLDKRRKGVIGPPVGMQCIIMVDDLNMPAKESYGAQPPIEILRQWMDHAGWYDREETVFRELVDIQFIAAMGPPGGGRTFITQRYVRHFNVLNFVPFSDKSLGRIFNTIVTWFLEKGGFNGKVMGVTDSVVKGTIDIYNTIALNLLPTPSKSHYLFNLRDISKVFQGVSQGNSQLIQESVDMVRIWSHECMRVFGDRLTDDDDRKWFRDMLSEKVSKWFDSMSFDVEVCGHSPTNEVNRPLLFGNYMQPGAVTSIYQHVNDFDKLDDNMREYLDEYNSMTKKPMSLVLFGNAIEHISRISRVINQPYGNALLVGVGGSGRKSLTTLAVSIADFKLFQIEISKSYGILDWREDMKLIMNMAGEKNQPTVFMMDDTQIVYESFLEDVNGILNTGEVANLFNGEELMAIFSAIEKQAAADGINTSNGNDMYSYFVGRCRENLHVVLCMSPIGEAFRTRLRFFPALVNCCTIDWFTEWPEEALRTVASYFLDSLEMEDKIRSGLVNVCVSMQELVTKMSLQYRAQMGRFFYVTPTSYLELISTFKGLLNLQRNQVSDAKNRYDSGLHKIADTQTQVDHMQKELIDLQPKLKEATVATDALIVQIDKDTIEANEKKALVSADEVECQKQSDEANEIKTSCEADLAKALPALDGAIKALKSLSKGDIVEVKAMGKPPNGVKLVMEALCLMFNIKPEKIKDPDSGKKVDDYWGTSKRVLLGDTKFLDNLLNYDKDNMDPDMVVKVNKFCAREDFTPEIVQKGSVAAAGLCKWVHAMMIYDDVSKNVAPKKAALKVATESLAASTALLNEKQAVLKEVLDKLAALQAGLVEAQEKKESLAAQVDDCSKKLARAEQLISGLGGERDRWQEFSISLGKQYDNVTGDIMLSAGVVAYLGSFVSSYRETALKTWSSLLIDSGITCSSPFSLASTLGSPVDIRQWVINKLPNDNVSIENAIMLQRSNRWPLMIDPQGQANRWVKNTEAKNSLKVVKQTQSTFVRTIEAALQYGNPVLLENLQESIDPVLEPVLLKQIVTVGGAATIKLGDATVDYDVNFKLYLTTKLRNPHYPPELCVKVNLLNFMATAEGLEDQMQGIAVAKEETELEALRERLVLEDAESKATLQEIEDQILSLLQNAEGNILDDEVLINTLAESKRTSNVIEEKVAEAAKTQVVIQETRKGYQPVAKHASILFFCIADLSVIDPMYQYSLDWFISLFQLSIDKAEQPDPSLKGAEKLNARIELLNSCFTLTLYLNICRSLFEKDKLLFSCLLTTKIMLGAKRLEPSQLHFLLTGAMSVDLPKPNPYHEWLPDKAWGDLLEMDNVEGLNGFLSEIFMNQPQKWKEVLDSDNAAHDIAALCRPKTSDPFALICVERAIRPDIVVPEMQSFVSLEMGEQFIQPPPLDLMACFQDSLCNTPLIFVLTPGADPISALIKVAEELGKASDMTSISLGQGQGPLASEAIERAQEKGWWVCLQNCHLSVSWLPTLERICEEINPESCHKDFRLWLTSEPSPHFPAYILQNGVKMTMEPPKGMRASLIGSWYKVEPEWFESCTKPAIFKKLLYGLTFLHATVIERRKFGPLGWNVKYVFSGPDMSICMDQLKIFLNDMKEGEEVPYAALAYLAGECNYGGRCTDDKDRRCLVNTISEFYCEDILKDDHKFSVSGTYRCPPEGDLESYRAFVQKLPYTEGPEVFGLHNNANISCALTETNDLLNTMQSLQPQSGGSTGKSWDSVLLELASDIAGKIPEQYDIDMALLDFPVSYSQCMNTVLVQELIRFNRVIKVVSQSLKEVARAVKGLVVMSGELEAMGNSVVLGKVPVMWGAVSYPSLKTLGGWVKDFLERLEFLRKWFEAKKAPPRFWISGFFFTQAFITGTLQNFARKFQIPIDQTDFDFSFLTPQQEEVAINTAPADGAYVYGLFMEGARWNVEAHWLDESLPRILFVTMPHLHLWPKEKRNIEPIKGRIELYTGLPGGEAHVYNCPVYKTSERRGVLLTTGHSTNFVMMIRIPMSPMHTQIHWIKRGVAMLTALDD